MAEDEDAIDELIDRIQQLSAADRRDLLDSLREDRLDAYLDARGEFIDHLQEAGLVGTYPPDSPWAEYCAQHPQDPLCWRMLGHERLSEERRTYQRARDRFVERLQERGLLAESTAEFGDVAAELGLTPVPDGIRWPWWLCLRYPWLCDLCRRYPWLCGLWQTDPVVVPDPGPLDPEMGGVDWGRTTPLGSIGPIAGLAGPMGSMAGPTGMGAEPTWTMPRQDLATRAGLDPRAFGVEGGRSFQDDVGLRIDLCARYPWLPWCCPPICYHQPWLPWCRRCWW